MAPTPVDEEGWNDIDEEDTIDSLSKTYGLKIDTDQLSQILAVLCEYKLHLHTKFLVVTAYTLEIIY